MATTVSVVGTIATDPKYSDSPGKQNHCSFRLACNDRRFDTEKQEWIDGETSWFTVNTFRAMAEHAHLSFSKGDRVIVMGRLRMRDWQTAERSGTTVIIDAEALGHDIRWGMGKFVRIKPREEAPAQGSDQQGLASAPTTGEFAGAAVGAAQASWANPAEGLETGFGEAECDDSTGSGSGADSGSRSDSGTGTEAYAA